MYTLSNPKGILRKNGVVIPLDDRFPAYQEYVAWLKQGNGPEMVEESVRDPITVSSWQIRKALNQSALRQAVEDAVAASTDTETKDGWEYATEFRSDHPLIISLSQAIGLTEERMYEVFQLAMGL